MRAPERKLRSVRQLALLGTALALLAMLVLYHVANVRVMFIRLNMNDFGKFYYSARLFLDGQDMYGPNPATRMPIGEGRVHAFLNMNPPHLHLAILPLARLHPAAALAIWSLAGIVALACSVRLTTRELHPSLSAVQSAWLAVAAAAFAGTGALVITGQLSLFLLLITTAAWSAARHGRWRLAGTWLGVLISIKPFGLVFIPWLAFSKRWDAIAATAVAVTAAFLTGVLVFGIDAHRSWIRVLGATDWTWAAMNASFSGAFSRWFGDSPYFAPALHAPGLIRPFWLLAVAITAGVSISLGRLADTVVDIDRAFAALLLGALLISPLGWVYYWWLPLPPLAALIAQHRMPLLLWAVPWLFVPLVVVVSMQPHWLATLTIGSAYFWGTFLAWLSVALNRTERWKPGAVR
jgi:hypothetical protein